MSSNPGYDPAQMQRVASQLQTIIDAATPHHSLPRRPALGTLWHDLKRDIIRAYEERAELTATRNGRAVIMAGPPGAGKSRAVEATRKALGPTKADTIGIEGPGFITIDADDIKPLLLGIPNPNLNINPNLLNQAHTHWQQVINNIAPNPLHDGKPILPGELATLVHQLSTNTADQIRGRLLKQRYDVKIEGTLQWLDHTTGQGQGPRLINELKNAGYNTVTIIAVNTPETTCQQGAFQRWAQPRTQNKPDARYTPPTAITTTFKPGNPTSHCINNAKHTHQLATKTTLKANLFIIHRHTKQQPQIEHTDQHGKTHILSTPAPPTAPAKTTIPTKNATPRPASEVPLSQRSQTRFSKTQNNQLER